MKRQPTEWEKMFTNDAIDKGLISKIQIARADQHQKTKQPNQKMAETLNRHFLKEELEIAQKHLKRCSTSLVIREMQIKTTVYDFTPVRMAIIKKFANSKLPEKVWRKGNPLTLLVAM